MSLADLPNEILAKIFQKTRQMDMNKLKIVNKRFNTIMDRYNIKLPIAETLKIFASPRFGGWSPLIQIYVIVKVAHKRNYYVQKSKSIEIDTPGSNRNTIDKMAEALVEFGIGGCKEFMFDYLTANYNYMYLLVSAGFDPRALTAVRRVNHYHEEIESEDIKLPFINDKWLQYINYQNVSTVSMGNVMTKISAGEICKFIEERTNNYLDIAERFNFGKIVMSENDHEIIEAMTLELKTTVNVNRIFTEEMYSVNSNNKKFKWRY